MGADLRLRCARHARYTHGSRIPAWSVLVSELHPFRVLPKYRKLMSEGAEANAIVIKADNTLASGTWRLTLRVEFGDGTTTEIERQ